MPNSSPFQRPPGLAPRWSWAWSVFLPALGCPSPAIDTPDTGAAVAGAPFTDDPVDLASTADIIAGLSAGDRTGEALALPGDLTGDGVGDLVVSAPTAPMGSLVYVVPGPFTKADVALIDAYRLVGPDVADLSVGMSVAAPGDADGDGIADLVVGSWQWPNGGDGAAYFVHGPVTEDQSLADAKGWLGSAGQAVGARVAAAGDVDGDGIGDVLLSDITPRVYLVDGLEFSLDGAKGVYIDDNPDENGGFGGDGGLGLQSLGDVDQDGYDDIAIAACGAYPASSPSTTWAGEIYIFHGPFSGEHTPGDADVTIVGVDAQARPGAATAAADLDGDGSTDLILGAPRDGTNRVEGAVYVVAGPFSGTISLSDSARLTGVAYDWAGGSLASLGDVDGDGTGDLLVGVPQTLPATGVSPYPGRAVIARGPFSGSRALSAPLDKPLLGATNGDATGLAVAAGDADVFIGAPYANDQAGLVYHLALKTLEKP